MEDPVVTADGYDSTNYLNENGKIVKNCIEDLLAHKQGLSLMNFVIMPDHVHLLLELDVDVAEISISSFIGEFKRQASLRLRKWMIGEKIWQRSFFDRIIRSDQEYHRINDYIEANPVNWEEDQDSPDFL